MQVDTGVMTGLVEQVAAMGDRLDELVRQVAAVNEAERILARAGMPAPMREAAGQRAGRHARDRHGLRVVRDGDRR